MTHFTPSDKAAAPTTAAPAPQPPAQNDAEGEQPNVTAPKIQASKARVEYRDQHGNVLPEDLVAELRKEGRIKFETRYAEHLDHAHDVDLVDGEVVAPPHPDVQGQNPETRENAGDAVPPERVNERSVERQGFQEAKPASERNEATQ